VRFAAGCRIGPNPWKHKGGISGQLFQNLRNSNILRVYRPYWGVYHSFISERSQSEYFLQAGRILPTGSDIMKKSNNGQDCSLDQFTIKGNCTHKRQGFRALQACAHRCLIVPAGGEFAECDSMKMGNCGYRGYVAGGTGGPNREEPFNHFLPAVRY